MGVVSLALNDADCKIAHRIHNVPLSLDRRLRFHATRLWRIGLPLALIVAACPHAWASTDEAIRQANLLIPASGLEKTDATPPPTLIDFSQEGSWTFQSYGSAALGEGSGKVYTAHFGVGYFFRENLSLNLELVGGSINLNEGHHDSAVVYGMDLLMRWHFYNDGVWAAHLEAGAGMHKSSHPFPAEGTHFNFRPQLGIGFTYSMTPNVKLMAGVRWLHISNANKDGSLKNPGFDGYMLYSGFMLAF